MKIRCRRPCDKPRGSSRLPTATFALDLPQFGLPHVGLSAPKVIRDSAVDEVLVAAIHRRTQCTFALLEVAAIRGPALFGNPIVGLHGLRNVRSDLR
jgi:hypothetical protein